ncbi:hypothetical protein SEA_GODONK_196 [Gordonia phage GodonK]|nr:hypothetical protein HOV33_gp172 [Gordonia phage GodonK]QBZ72784.1 hypothetical protein SEA_GODONK_196 [Gordonia phage GodonK]
MSKAYNPDVLVEYSDLGDDGSDLESKQWTFNDGSRTVKFNGVRLSSVSSEREGRPRWTEIEAYRTDGGYYVLHRIGVSAIVHSINCDQIAGKQLPGAPDVKPEEIRVEDRQPCPFCRPDVRQSLAEDPASLRIEVDRHWIAVCATAAEAVESLHTRRNDTKMLSFLAQTLIRNAGEHDAEMASESSKL